MNLLTVQQASKSYTERMLFDNITLGINEGDKIGVIGINGTGKSTLLKMVAGLVEPDEGQVVKGSKIQVEYLAQNPEFDMSKTILQNVISEKTRREEHWNIEGEAKAMLKKLAIEDVDAYCDTLSGGQKKRVALVRTLLTPADILVLDEPTNHLDNEMAQWLEDYLIKYRGAFLMVTHDRYFLDKVTNRIVELDRSRLFSYDANYSKFLELKAQREEMELATERKNESIFRMELEWMKRGARARSTKQKARIERFENLKDRERPLEDGQVEMTSMSSRLGRKIIEINDISKRFGDKELINHFTYTILKNDRLGIVGPNGCGKSTLLNMITGRILPDSGEIDCGQTVKIGYFAQENIALNNSTLVINHVKEIAEYLDTPDGKVTACKMLERFLFPSQMQYTEIGRLSGGEKRRLYLLTVLMEAPNVLILDEPTNDLDIQTLTILENYLDTFDGVVITVSHDRYFLDRVVDRIFAFEDGGVIKQYEGNFTDYFNAVPSDISNPEVKKENQEKEVNKSNWKMNQREAKLKFTYNEQKEYNEIDQIISSLEEKLVLLEQEMVESATNYTKLNELMAKKEALGAELEEKMDRWVYLNDLAERIAAQGK